MDNPVQILRPIPNDIIHIPLVLVMFTPTPSPPSRIRSGANFIGISLSRCLDLLPANNQARS